MNSVFAVNPKLYPLFIKPLYDLLEKQKNNWLIIKIIKLLDKILLLEPRLIKKLVDPYQKLLKSTSAKSIEFELLNTIIRHFKEHSSLYNQACDNLKSFINHIDANLRSLGLSCLKTMLNNNKKVLPEYKDYLLESLKKADLPTKKQILEIFHCFVEKDLLEDIVSELLQYLEETPNNRNLDENLKEALIETIMKLCKKDNFIHIEDFEWLLFEVFGKLMRKVTNVILAKELSSNLLTLILRVQDLKSCVQKFCVNTLMGFDEIAIEKQTFSELKISIQGRLKRPEISAKEIVFQTLVFLAGEYAYNCRMPSEFFGLLEYFDNEKLLYLYGNSYHLVKEACFKIAVGLCGLLVDSSMEKLKGNLEKIELKSESLRFLGDLNEAPNQNILIWTMVRVLGYLLSLNQKLLKLNHSNIYDNGSSNLMMGFLFSAIGLDYKGLITEEIRLGDQGILEKITLESLKKIADLRKLFKNELKPVHPEAQKFVKIPEGLLLDIGLEIDPIEVEMMISMKREFDIEENTLNKNKDEKKGKRNKKNKEKEIIEIKNEENTQKGEIIENNNNKEKNEEEGKKNENEEVKEKKEYILNVEDYLPPGVDVTMLKKNEEGEKPIKKKKNKIKEIK